MPSEPGCRSTKRPLSQDEPEDPVGLDGPHDVFQHADALVILELWAEVVKRVMWQLLPPTRGRRARSAGRPWFGLSFRRRYGARHPAGARS